jgi:hypothetical protein
VKKSCGLPEDLIICELQTKPLKVIQRWIGIQRCAANEAGQTLIKKTPARKIISQASWEN